MLDIDDLFKGRHFDREIIILCVRWYLRFKISFRDLVEMMAERGVSLAHTTIMRWIARYVLEFEKRWNRFAGRARASLGGTFFGGKITPILPPHRARATLATEQSDLPTSTAVCRRSCRSSGHHWPVAALPALWWRAGTLLTIYEKSVCPSQFGRFSGRVRAIRKRSPHDSTSFVISTWNSAS